MQSHRTRAWITLGAVLALSGLGIGAASVAGSATPAVAEVPAAGALTVDSVHSFVVFKIRHLGASNTYGSFIGPSGTFEINADPAKSSLDVSVQADKLTTGNDKRDQHLRSPDFFSAKEFPTISFKATKFTAAGENAFNVTGDLSLHGVTKPATAHLVVVGTGKGMKGESITGVEATMAIKRSDFGMTTFLKEGAVGDEVEITVALEGHAQ